MMKLKQCSICSESKHIGFIHFITKQKYRLCQKHYYEWIQTKMTIDLFIRRKKNDDLLQQTKLTDEEEITKISEAYNKQK